MEMYSTIGKIGRHTCAELEDLIIKEIETPYHKTIAEQKTTIVSVKKIHEDKIRW